MGTGAEETKKKGREDDGARKDPETIPIPLMSSWKMQAKDSQEQKYSKIGLLTIRVIGYVQETQKDKDRAEQPKGKVSVKKANGADGGGDEEDDEDEDEDDDDDEEDEDEDEDDE